MALDIEGVMNYSVVRLLRDAMLTAVGPYLSINIFMAQAEADGVAQVCSW